MKTDFVKGARVRVTSTDATEYVAVGQVGTLLENDNVAPWVQFDEPTLYPKAVYKIPGSKAGYCACVMTRNLEIIS